MRPLQVFMGAEDLWGDLTGEWSFAGSCIQIAPTLALTCHHVVARATEIAVGLPQIASAVVACDEGADLALIELPEHAAPAPKFSRQWKLDEIYAHGYHLAPFARASSDGPIGLDRRVASADGRVEYISFNRGVPNGFSGGPVIGMFNQRPYCIGLSKMGGVGAAVSVLIPTDVCVEFVNKHRPGALASIDLAPAALLDYLDAELQRLIWAGRSNPLGRSVMVTYAGFRGVDAPLAKLQQINGPARQDLNAGQIPDRVAVPVRAAELATAINLQPAADPLTTLRLFLERHQPPLAIPDAIDHFFQLGSLVVLVTGVDAALPGDPANGFLVALHQQLATRWMTGRGK